MKFIATTSNKMSTIAVKSGQLIFSRDDRVIYLDSDIGRTKFDTIITLVTEQQRKALVNQIEGYYFVEETSIFWRYSNSAWTQITNPPTEKIIFIEESKLPSIGKKETLYITENVIYQWNGTDYVSMGGNSELTWKPIE